MKPTQEPEGVWGLTEPVGRQTEFWPGRRQGRTPRHRRRPGRKAFDKRLHNTEPKLRELFAKLQSKHGTVLVVVDQPTSIGAQPMSPATARDMGCPVA